MTGNMHLPILHSLIRNTRQPRLFRRALTLLSRLMLRAILLRQNKLFALGFMFLQLCPCQKQPSANTATRFSGKTKSGLPYNGYPLLHPRILSFRNILARAISVDLFREERTLAIMRDLARFVTVSITINQDQRMREASCLAICFEAI